MTVIPIRRERTLAMVHPITATVRPLNERLWILHQRCAAGTISEAEEAELNTLCALAEQQYQRNR